MAISPEQRKRFEKAGLELVRADYVVGSRRVISHGSGSLSADRVAAKEWMAEKEIKNSRRETLRYRLMMAFAALAAVGAVIAAVPVVKLWISN